MSTHTTDGTSLVSTKANELYSSKTLSLRVSNLFASSKNSSKRWHEKFKGTEKLLTIIGLRRSSLTSEADFHFLIAHTNALLSFYLEFRCCEQKLVQLICFHGTRVALDVPSAA
ncbi:hypothetical protein AVEN_183142-1 [Araneus ventricosus]|uniref:Uncharacterized protein n=1 Tax=Araneus ventricosus TaxID=182803 RepID=A0A4Y2IPE8_ARAVE|nr:hypothetical protein AVEN_183142-1 [Araneus ventricosus]